MFLGDFLGALGVVAGVQGLLILVERPVPLTRHIEDLAQVDVAPHFNPLRVQIAVESLPERVGCGLGAALLQEHLAYPEEGQRASLLQLDRPLILGNGLRVLTHPSELVPFGNEGGQLNVIGDPQDPMVGVDDRRDRLPEGSD